MEKRSTGLNIEWVHEMSRATWAFGEMYNIQPVSDIIIQLELTRDPDKLHLSDLGIIDDVDLIEEIRCRYTITEKFLSVPYGYEDMKVYSTTSETFEMSAEDLFPNGRFDSPHIEYLVDGLFNDIHREAAAITIQIPRNVSSFFPDRDDED